MILLPTCIIFAKEFMKIDCVNFAVVNKYRRMKKVYILTLLAALSMTSFAQSNTWEQAPKKHVDNNAEMKKYLAGAVPIVHGTVTFSDTIIAKGKSRNEIYNIALNYITEITQDEGKLENSIISYNDEDSGIVVGAIKEWLVFRSSGLVLDRTKLLFNLICEAYDGKLVVTMKRIHYIYGEGRDAEHYTADKWITDKYALNKTGTKLLPISKKFRCKTIDRYINIDTTLKNRLK
jgi:hypothetical protein